MKITHGAPLVAAAIVFTACQSGPGGGSAALDTDDQKASYGIGLNMGRTLAPAQGRLDMDAFLKGVQDAMEGQDPAIDQAEIQTALQAFSESIQAEEAERRAADGEANRAEGEAYLAENAQREGVTVTESGLQYEVLEPGDGPSPGPEDEVTIHYRGTLVDGTEFDSSYSRGQPATFGVGGVIAGFGEGLQLMEVGSNYRFVIPSDLAYGPNGSGQQIGPDATLIFQIELLAIE